MPGTFVFKPIEANLTHNTEWFGKMDPYFAFVVGGQRINSSVCKKGGKHPHWSDSLSIPITNQSKITVELIDKDSVSSDDQIGSFIVDLNEIEKLGQLNKWYPLYYKNKQAGEVHLQSYFEGGQYLNQSQPQVLPTGLGTFQKEVQASTFHGQYEEESRRVFVEQRQTVEPHTFLKEVDVVETRPVVKEIEVLEPHKVLKEVQYTEAVPVKKHIETIEPKVVLKDVEVIEPRLVTKQIQVIENVPVMKHVEVIESVPVVKEIDTYEPQTFTKTVEVTEQVPVKKQVTVTEPFTTKKPVEFIEPIITTKTITKEVLPATIIDEKITKEVGPASVIGYSTASSKESSFSHHSAEMRYGEQKYVKAIPVEQTEQVTKEFQQVNVGGQPQTYSSSYQKTATTTGGPYSGLFEKDPNKQIY